MHLCLSMWSVHRKFFHEGWTVLDFLHFCSKHDVDNVELLDVFWRDEETEVPQVLEYMSLHGMHVDAYAVTNDFVQSDVEKRDDAQSTVLKGAELAKAFGAPVVRVFSGELKEGYDFDSALAYIVDGFKAVTANLAQEDPVLALENHGKLAGRGHQVKQIIHEVGSPKLRSTFDVGNFYLVGQQPMEALAELSSYIAHVHAKDFAKHETGLLATTGEYFQGRACGDGIVPFADLLATLRYIDYAGSVSLEYEGDGDEVEGVLQSIAFLKPLIEQAAPANK